MGRRYAYLSRTNQESRMKFLYRKYPAKKGEVIEVNLSEPALVKFMTAKEFKNYGAGRTHTYYKGRTSDDGPVRFELPFDGIWHAVVEKGATGVSATCKLCPPDPEYHRLASPTAELEQEYPVEES